MRITLEITPDEMRGLLAMRERIEGDAWEPVSGIAGSQSDSIGGYSAPHRVVEKGAPPDAPGSIVAGFVRAEDAALAAMMHDILRRAIFEEGGR